MNKIKVLHLTHTDVRLDSRILKELSAIRKSKQTLIMAIGISDDNLSHCKFKEVDKGLTSLILYSKFIKYFSARLTAYLCLTEFYIRLIWKGLLFRPKIIHCHDTIVLPVGVILSLLFNSKLIYDAHELESQKNGQSKVLSKITLFIEKISWRFIDLLITVSPSIIDWYQKNLGKKESLLILNSPQLKLENYDAESNNYLREKFNIPENRKVFVYLGIIGKGRGIDLYLSAFQSKEINSHVVFIGFGEDVKKIQDCSLNSKKIHYHPVVKHDEVVKIAKSADVGLAMIEAVSLSDYYCLPNKLFEYAFSGLFILASDFPDMKKVIQDFDLGVCCSLDIESIKQEIIYIEGQDLKPSTKDLSTLSWQYQSEKLLNSYNKIIKINKH
jgi:glycosyltransferase involved in cell wall biosynthesis